MKIIPGGSLNLPNPHHIHGCGKSEIIDISSSEKVWLDSIVLNIR